MGSYSACLLVAREQLVAAQGKVMRLHEANAMLTEQVAEAMCNRDAAMADSSTTVIRAGEYLDLHATLLGACGSIIDVLSPVG
jgi:hypothetical protein